MYVRASWYVRFENRSPWQNAAEAHRNVLVGWIICRYEHNAADSLSISLSVSRLIPPLFAATSTVARLISRFLLSSLCVGVIPEVHSNQSGIGSNRQATVTSLERLSWEREHFRLHQKCGRRTSSFRIQIRRRCFIVFIIYTDRNLYVEWIQFKKRLRKKT